MQVCLLPFDITYSFQPPSTTWLNILVVYRYNLPVVIIVVNNNGIYSGVDTETWKEMAKMGDLTTM